MKLYVLVKFPEVQKYQELDGFEQHSQPATHVESDGDVLIDANWLNKKVVDSILQINNTIKLNNDIVNRLDKAMENYKKGIVSEPVDMNQLKELLDDE